MKLFINTLNQITWHKKCRIYYSQSIKSMDINNLWNFQIQKSFRNQIERYWNCLTIPQSKLCDIKNAEFIITQSIKSMAINNLWNFQIQKSSSLQICKILKLVINTQKQIVWHKKYRIYKRSIHQIYGYQLIVKF